MEPMLNTNGSKNGCAVISPAVAEAALAVDASDPMWPMEVSTTLAERESTHGPYAAKCATIQALKRTMHTAPNWARLNDHQCESLELIATKIGRILHGDPNHYDSWHDIEGYARLVTQELEAR